MKKRKYQPKKWVQVTLLYSVILTFALILIYTNK